MAFRGGQGDCYILWLSLFQPLRDGVVMIHQGKHKTMHVYRQDWQVLNHRSKNSHCKGPENPYFSLGRLYITAVQLCHGGSRAATGDA